MNERPNKENKEMNKWLKLLIDLIADTEQLV